MSASEGATDGTTPLQMTRAQALALVQRLLKEGEPPAARPRQRGLVNETFVYGEQFPEDRSQDRNVTDPGGMNASLTPSIPVNLTTPLLSTWESLLTKDRPTGVATPGTDRPEDIYDSRITQAVIEYEQDDLNSAEVVIDTVHLAGLHGTAAIKITYDPDDDRVVWAPCSIFNFLMDPSATNADDAGWFIFQDWNMSKEDAQSLFDKVGIEREPQLKPHSSPGIADRKGVSHVELWQKPTKEHPQGLYICLVDDEAVEIDEYPHYVERDDGSREYFPPLALMRVRKVRDTVYGNTNLTDVIPLQRAYNEAVNKIQRLLRQVTNIHLPLPQSLAETFDPTTTTIIAVPDAVWKDLGVKIDYTQPGQIHPSLFEQRDFFEKSMQKAMGLNDITASSDNPRLSGTAIQNMVALDAQRNADCTRSLQSMVIAAWELTIQLIGEFYQASRLGSMTNGDVGDVVSFTREDVKGKNVRIQLGSEVDSLQPAKERIAVDRLSQGLGTQADLVRVQRTPSYAMSKAAAEQLVQGIAQGMQPPPGGTDDIDPDVLQDIVNKAMAQALARKDRGLWARLEAFRRTLSSMPAAQANAAPPGPPGTPSPAPPAGPQPGS